MLTYITLLTTLLAAEPQTKPRDAAGLERVGRCAAAALAQLHDCPSHIRSYYAPDVAGMAHLAGRTEAARQAIALAVAARRTTEHKEMATQKLILGHAIMGNADRCRAMIAEMDRPQDRVMAASQCVYAYRYFRQERKAAEPFVEIGLQTYRQLDDDDRAEALVPLAIALAMTQRFEQAKALTDRHPEAWERVNALYILAREAALVGKAQPARRYLAEADRLMNKQVADDENRPRPSIFRVVALAEMGESERALAEFKTIEDESWQLATVPYLVLAYHHANEHERAAETIRQAERMLADEHPEMVAHTMGLLAAARACYDKPEALDAWVDAQGRAEVKAAMHAGIANSFFYQQNRRLIREQNRATTQPGDDLKQVARFSRLAYEQMGRCDTEARELYASSVASLAHLAGDKRTSDRALHTLFSAWALSADKAIVVSSMVDAYAIRGEVEKAEQSIGGLPEPSDKVSAYAWAAVGLTVTPAHRKDAQRFADQAVALYDRLPHEEKELLLYDVSWALAEMGQYGRARKLIDAGPTAGSRAVSLYNLAAIAAFEGETKAAKDTLAAADRLRPSVGSDDQWSVDLPNERLGALARLRDVDGAKRELANITDPSYRVHGLSLIARTQAKLGQRDAANETLKQAARLISEDHEVEIDTPFAWGTIAHAKAYADLHDGDLAAWIAKHPAGAEEKLAMYCDVASAYYTRHYEKARRKAKAATQPAE